MVDDLREEAARVAAELARQDRRDQALAGASPRRDRPTGLRQNAPSADDSPRGDRGMSNAPCHVPQPPPHPSGLARRPEPARPARGQQADRRVGSRRSCARARPRRSPSVGCSSVEAAVTPSCDCGRAPGGSASCGGPRRDGAGGLEEPLSRTSSSSSPIAPRAAPGTRARAPRSSSSGGPCSIAPAYALARTAWRPCTSSLRCSCAPPGAHRRRSPRDRPDRASLWAGLFDLRDTLLGSTVDDLRSPLATCVRSLRLVVVGSVNLDLVARCEQLPRPGETVTGATFDRVPGRQGREPASRAPGSARRSRSSPRSATTRLPRRRSRYCARPMSRSTCSGATRRPASP